MAAVYLDLYCERVAPGLWGEPLNTVTNLGFLLAAALLLRRYRVAYDGDLRRGWDRLLLIALLATIGLGSSLWHLTAQGWAMWADVLPILAFISVYLLVFLVRIAGLGPLPALGLFLVYHAFNSGMQAALPADTLNGSIFYLPTWIALVLMTGYLKLHADPRWRPHAQATALLLISLAFRTMDRAVCGVWPVGTHFLWHLLNAWLLYLLVRAALDAGRSTVPASS
jgi:Ceramidase